MFLKTTATLLAAMCIMSTAFAQQKPKDSTSIFDSLQIKKKEKTKKITGKDAVRAVIGKPILFEFPNGKILYIFDDEKHFRLRQTAPKDGEISGILTKSWTKDRLCFDFQGLAQNHCEEIHYKNNMITLVSEDKNVITGTVLVDQAPPKAKPPRPFPAAEPTICNPLRAIVKEASTGAFENLIDQNNTDDDMAPYRHANIKLGRCLVVPYVSGAKVDCTMTSAGGPKKANELYQTLIMQTYLCLRENIKKTDVNTHLAEFANTGILTAYSHFDFAHSLRISIHIGEGETCTFMGVKDCEEQKGVFVRAYYTE